MEKARTLIERLLSEVCNSDGSAAVQKYRSLRDVDAKVREFGMLLGSLPDNSRTLRESFEKDVDFTANSRRVRLEALANYCRTVLRFLDNGIIENKKQVFKGPVLSKITAVMPQLEEVIQDRWIEAQKCQHAGAYLAAVILMGSILEALLLSRATMTPADCYTASRAPKDKNSKILAVQDWNLSSLIEVAAECGWLKVDRAKFSHALRESRNVVHPWQHVALRAEFDEATCKTCWHVLNASVDDLLKSISQSQAAVKIT